VSLPDPNPDPNSDLASRLAAKQKLHPDYASPYDRPVIRREPGAFRRYFVISLYLAYWLLIPLIILALLWYIRSSLSPFLTPKS